MFSQAQAVTFNIANGDVAGLISAINTANTNNQHDTINLLGGTFTLTAVDNTYGGANGLPVIDSDNGHNLTIDGGTGATIQRAPGSPQFRIFYITGANHNVLIGGVTIRGGDSASEGGGIHNNSTLTLGECTLVDNHAVSGGAIASTGHPAFSPNLTLDNCVVRDNTSNQGGGIYNYAESFAGLNSASATLTVTNCTFFNNDAGVSGGGINSDNNGVNSSSSVTITGCTFSDNGPSALGGGIYNRRGPLTLSNSTFSGNSTSSNGNGAGLYHSIGTVTVKNCTFSGNIGFNGGAIYLGSGALSIGNTILKTGSSGANFFNSSGTITSLGYNLSNDNGGGFLIGPADQINIDPLLDPYGLQANGGPTLTIALTNGSPAIDKGKNFGPMTDQRGQARPWDNPAITPAGGGDNSDIGAFEATDPVQGGTGLVVNTTTDHGDGICGGSDCTLREAIQRANTVGGSNTITFASGLTGTIILLTAQGGQLTISDSTTITGPGARLLKIDGNTQTRVFLLSGGTVSMSGLTISGGWMTPIATGAPGEGGGIYNSANLMLSDCTVEENRASGTSGGPQGQAGGSGRGAGIFNAGVLTLERCTFKNNGATGGFGASNPPQNDFDITRGGDGGGASGGAIFNDTAGNLTIFNCTFAANNAGAASGGSGHNGGNGGNGLGGGVYNLGILSVYASTFSGNTGFGGSGGTGSAGGFNGSPGLGAGGLAAAGGSSTLRNTISAGNSASGTFRYDIFGTFNSIGYNLIGRTEGGSGFTATGDQTGSNASPLNAQLASLGNNDGPTDTMRPLSNSPAIDKGQRFSLTTDQRGRGRPSDIPSIANASGGDGSDIGAYEVGGLLIVTTLDDHSDGVCSMNDCTLREAILTADAQTLEQNVIAFAAGVTGTIQLASSLPQVATNTSIVGPGAGLLTVRRNTGGNYGIFLVSNNTTSGPTVTISGLTISNGLPASGSFPQSSGSGILNSYSTLTISNCVITGNSTTGFPAYGGGIFNYQGTVTVNNSTVSGNSSFNGGGIANFRDNPGTASLTVTNSTLSGNMATGDGGAFHSYAANVGAIATAALTNCTLSGNSASGAFGGNGGAIYNTSQTGASGAVALTHCTLTNNSASTSGGSISNVGAQVTLRNSILKSANANIANSSGTITSQGYNLSNDSGGGFLGGSGDQINTDPLLGLLANNGGLTQTHMPLVNSPAIDRGKSFGFATDQRGLARIMNAAQLLDAVGGDGADIGALEVNPSGSLTDADGDGMPDEWEIFYGIDDPNGDADGDGLTNLQEYKAGTNPLDRNSWLRVTGVSRNGNDFTVTFSLAVVGKTYRLERKNALSDANWGSITGVPDLAPTSTGSGQITDPGGATVTKHFYHVRVLP